MKPLILTLLVIVAGVFDTGGVFTGGELFSVGLTLFFSGVVTMM